MRAPGRIMSFVSTREMIMSPTEIAYLTMVLAAFGLYTACLAYVSKG